MLQFKINDEIKSIDRQITITQMLQLFGYNPLTVAVERNQNILSRSQWDNIFVNDGDNFEVVMFVGGG